MYIYRDLCMCVYMYHKPLNLDIALHNKRPIMKIKQDHMDWGDRSVTKEFDLKAQEPEFDTQKPCPCLFVFVFYFFKPGTEEIVQSLRVLNVLPEDFSSVSTTCSRRFTTTAYNSSSMVSDTSFSKSISTYVHILTYRHT